MLFTGSGSRTLNLRDDTLAGIELLDFGQLFGAAGATEIVQLRAAQFGPGIAANATIYGSVTNGEFGSTANATDRLDVVMDTATSLDLSGLTFFGFSDPGDFVLVIGDDNNETVRGSSVADRIYGNGGNDTLDGFTGADRLDGGLGNDTYVTDGGDILLETSASGGTDTVKSSATLALAANLEHLTLTGSGTINGTGNGLNNTITGNGAANILNGLTGADVLIGGSGNDSFIFSTALGSGNVDRITDFSSAADTIRLDRSVFSALALGTLSASAYKDIGDPGAVVDADDRILYNDDTGALFYDANGSGSGGQVQFALLENKPATVVPADFLVVA